MEIDRRDFLKVSATAAGGMLLTIYGSRCKPAGTANPFSPNAFLRIDSDGTVTVTIPRPEMGQGVRTSLAMLIAEGLDCDWEKIRIEQADLNPKKYGDQYVGGSSSIRDSFDLLRNAGAVARSMLISAAAEQWKTDSAVCTTEQGNVIHKQSKRKMSYGELVESASRLPIPKKVESRERPFRLIGKAKRNLDTKDIATGRIHYGIDTRVPGMLFASVQHCPFYGGKAGKIDDTEAKQVQGVQAVIRIDADAVPEFGDDKPKMPSGVAVIAELTWTAMKASNALHVEWDPGSGVSAGTDQMRRDAIAHAHQAKWVYRKDGDPDAEIAKAHRVIDAVYEVPLLAHATMEPMNCVADVRADRAEIWAPTQNPQAARDVVKKLTGLKEDAIVIHPTRMGGGFGRRFYNDYVAEAVFLSKATGKPVRTLWTREEDMRHGFYRPAGYHVLRGGLDTQGNPLVWMHHLVNASRGHYQKWEMPGMELKPGEIGSDDYPVGLIPNSKIEYTPLDSVIPRGQWRAVEESSNVFVIQSFLAELAEAAGKNELDVNLQLLAQDREVPYYGGKYQTGRLKKVFEAAADFGDWGKPLPRGWGRGIAGSYSNSSFVAQVAEVEISDSGKLRVHRIVAAVDCGTVVNPAGVEAQIQGAILFALSAALTQQITVEKGQAVQGNFDDYPVMRIAQTPRIEVHILPGDSKPCGIGECAVGQTAPAVCNAIFHACGKRIRVLPILKDGVTMR